MSALKIKIQIYCGDEIAMGPGKADLLEAITREGSISAAGRALGMSYRRTWLLVDMMNRCWNQPLVETAAGGSHGGGARVTDLGKSVLTQYRSLQATAQIAERGEDWTALQSVLRTAPKADQKQP
jgi:molybdate transport system regulatory protein